MSSKRQQVRNERTLQDLVETVPGNNTCADCFARNPGWASWSLGIFICMRCAGLHRKLGTHISKVKSLSMDSWSNEQVEFMKRTGNIASNRIYNPTNTKPDVPLDIDEVDPAMEKYIRQKYVNKDLQGAHIQPQRRHDTGSTESDGRHSPPPLPPKGSTSRFGFKSASSMFAMSSKAKRRAEASAQESAPRSPPMVDNKPSKIFGTSVGESGTDDIQSKLETLREMGFYDEKRNMTVLKGLNGNLERSIETLVRLGEGTKPILPARPAARPSTAKETSGISFEKPPPRQEMNSSLQSNNPFDMPTPQPQSSQSTGTLGQSQYMNGSNPYQSTMGTNPFGPIASQSQYDINQSFQNLSVSNNTTQSQTLFPHRTGGFPSQHHQHQKFLPSLETSIPAIPQQYPRSAATPYSSVYDFPPQQQNSGGNQQQQTYNNPFLQQAQPAAAGNATYSANPYLQHAATFPMAPPQQPTDLFGQMQTQQAPQQSQQQQQHQAPQQCQPYDWTSGQSQQQRGTQQPQTQNPYQQPQPQNPYQQPQPQTQNQNPYQQPQNPYQQPQPQAQNQNPYQQSPSQNQNPYQQPQVQQPWNNPQPQPQTQNPYQQHPQAQQGYAQQPQYQQSQQPQYQQYQQPQQLTPQQTGRANKTDIMALYNYPQLAPPVPQIPAQHSPEAQQQNGNGQSYQPNGQQPNTAPPAANSGSNNPFMNAGGNGSGQNGNSKQSRESIMVEGTGWMNGRHSPDAFASLSGLQTRGMR